MGSTYLRDHIFAGHAVAAAGAASVATSLTHPIDTLKTLHQVAAGPKQKLSLSQVVHQLKSVSGLAGLYSGLGWSTLSKIGGLGARFGTFEILTAFYKDGRDDNYVYVSEAMLAGMTAGALENLTCTPFELLKTRAQLSSTSKLKPPNTLPQTLQLLSALQVKGLTDSTVNPLTKPVDLLNALKVYPWMRTGSGRAPLASEVKGLTEVVKLEGFGGLYRGVRAGFYRDCVFGGVFFATWQFLHEGMLTWKSLDLNPPPRKLEDVGPVSPLASSLAAGFSATIAAATSHSFDTAKVRSHCIVTPKYIMMERKMLRWQKVGNWLERVTGMSPADRNLIFRGIWLRMARSGVATFALVGSYYLAIDYIL